MGSDYGKGAKEGSDRFWASAVTLEDAHLPIEKIR
jgi:hypothetical protein